ncbi:V-set and immunoglobulin domain-containing protein 10-like isoform X1 [Esox lucius]|uniref:V-set and immunoglobulin domain containing 10 like n=1 Tax=Esox lucius TaxID=8010 RepID=A0A3P9A8Q1_ESOLU|nr:V-set and immunoglobulin domain-containing protein 10-like isoform X1 [Esox lucius]
MPSHQFGVLKLLVFKVTLLMFMIEGVNCALSISLRGPSLVNATVGSNVTLAVTILGAPDPMVTWKMGGLPVVIWTLGSSEAPAISDSNRDVLTIEADGSLTFQNLSFAYSNTYTLDIIKVGMVTVSAKFSLNVYDYIRNVSVTVQTADAIEGADKYTLQYSSVPGEPSQWWWYFNSVLIRNSSHYTVDQKSLVIHQPSRTDTGRYTLVLSNPFSAVTAHRNITVLYGPDEPVLGVSPSQTFFVSGESLALSCRAEGVPLPSASWLFQGHTIGSQGGRLNLTSVQTSQGGIYTCELFNENTGVRRKKNLTINVYERPAGSPLCSVNAAHGNANLQFNCHWPGGTPEASLSFPFFNTTTSGAGDFSLTRPASQGLNGKTILCRVDHPLLQTQCSITLGGPAEILLTVTAVDQGGQIVVNIQCHSQAMPKAMVTWLKGSEILANGMQYQINEDTTQLSVHGFNSSVARLYNYTCNCSNPLGNTAKETQLLGPTISYSHLFPNGDGTAVTITWEVPPTSVITGFDIQMSGPDLMSKSVRPGQKATDNFRTVQQKPSTSRSANISTLDPKSTYQFRVIPVAGGIQGKPSEVQSLGPGLSQSQIIGLAAGIPCGVIFLLLLIGLICLCICCSRKKRKANRYPVARVVEKVVTTQPNINAPSYLLTGGLKPQPDHDRKNPQMDPTERSVPIPRFVSPPHVRTATIV